METASVVKALYKASQRKIFYSQEIALNLQQKWLQMRDQYLNLQIDGETHHYYWLNPVCRAFTEDQRKYHNFYHIDKLYEFYENMLISKGLIDVEDQYTNSTFLLALWFHDIIYDPKAKDNEERSRIVFQEYIKKNEKVQKYYKMPDENLISPQQIQLVENIIMATVKHQIDESKFETPKDLQICKLFLDADLSVLGSLPDDYDEYAQRIIYKYLFLQLNQEITFPNYYN